jgi:hypothetical protein
MQHSPPRMFVIAGTLVPSVEGLPLIKQLKHIEHLMDRFGVRTLGFDRFVPDLLYLPVKRCGVCWVQPMPRMGLGDPATTYAALKLRFLLAVAAGDYRPIVVKGQSQGGLFALLLALDPDTRHYVAGVIITGTPLAGTTQVKRILWGVGERIPGFSWMDPGSADLHALQAGLRRRWPRNIPVIMVFSPDDELVKPWRVQIDQQMRKGTDRRLYLVSPHDPAMVDPEWRERHPHVHWLQSSRPVHHLEMEWHWVVRLLTREFLDERVPLPDGHPVEVVAEKPTLLVATA